MSLSSASTLLIASSDFVTTASLPPTRSFDDEAVSPPCRDNQDRANADASSSLSRDTSHQPSLSQLAVRMREHDWRGLLTSDTTTVMNVQNMMRCDILNTRL